MNKEILTIITASLLAGVGSVQAQNISDLITEGGFEAAAEPTLTTTAVGQWHVVDHAEDTAIRLRSSPVKSGSKACEFDFNWGTYSLTQTLGVTVESGKDYGIDLWHSKFDLHTNTAWAEDPEFTVEVWTSEFVGGTYALAVTTANIPADNAVGVFGNYTGTFTTAELAPYVGEYLQIRIKKQISPVRGDLQVDDVKFGTVITDPVFQTDPAEVALTLSDASAVIPADVTVSYLEGAVPANVTITSVSVVSQSHPGSFTDTTAVLPLTIVGPDPVSDVVSIQFDNTVAGLIEGETATGTLEIVWNEVGSAMNHTASLPVSAEFLEVHDGNILAVFNNTFDDADRTLAGIEATITAGNRSNTQGSNDGTYGTLTGLAPTGPGAKIGNGDVPTFDIVITNNTGADATLDNLSFDAGLMWPDGPDTMNIALTGDLTPTPALFSQTGFSLFSGQAGDYEDFDVDLTGLAKNVLADGESATFTFTFSGVTPGGEFVSLIVDNIAFTGSGTAAAILTREAGPIDSPWVNLPVTGGVSSYSQAIPMSYSEGDAVNNINITNIIFSDESPVVGAFGHDATLPIVLSTPDVVSDVFNLTFDNSVANLAPGEFAEATVTIEWNEGGASTRTLEFDAYATRPALASGNVIALFEREFLTPDVAVNGVLGWMAGGKDVGLTYYQLGSEDGTFGTLSPPAASTDPGRWLLNNEEPVATLTLTNTSTNAIELTDLHFDVGRWYPGSPEDFTLSVSGDVTADPALLVETGLTELGFNGTDFDDFDVDLTGLADHTLGAGESVVFTFTFVSLPGDPYLGAFLDNLAVLGIVDLPPVLEIVNNDNGTVTLTWNGPGTLQSGPSVEGPWTNVPGSPPSPAILSIVNAKEFYRAAE